MLDFNEPDLPGVHGADAGRDGQREEVRSALLSRLESVLVSLFPAGKRKRGTFYIGDILGSPGDSLEIVLDGEKAGLWTDRANGSGGDLFDLIAGHYGISIQTDFPAVLAKASNLAGAATLTPARKAKREAPTDDLGPATAKWDYLDAAGHLIAVVYRYDPPGKRKEFRPWDAKRHKMAPPNPRPLYNQPGMTQVDHIVLVEGEKCAQVLIDIGVCATTAMHGANAPVDKTDWSPLENKHVLIWPYKDKAGWDYADRASQAILGAGATSCAILYPPVDMPEGWDVADALRPPENDIIDVQAFDVTGFLRAADRLPVVRQVEASTPTDLVDGVDFTTEDGLANAFTRRYGADWLYCADWGKWLVWNNVRWNMDKSLYVNFLSRTICRAASFKASSARLKARLASSSTISAVERIARSDPRHASLVEQWDADPWLLNTPSGVIDLHTGAMRAHQRADRMTKVCTAVPQGECPNWLAFLNDVTGGDTELVAYLQRVVGYCLTGDISSHALFFFYGTGANGKSVFLNVISTILGDYAANAPMDTFMETRSDRHPTDLAGLRGARLVSATETEQGRRWAESKIKAITGGDPVTARHMYKDFFTYPPQYKLLIAGNHKPAIRNVDEAMRRRLHLVPFTITVPPERRDPRLTERLLAERDGILAWAVQGCLDWQQVGLKAPASVMSATDEYLEAEDATGRWLEDRCNFGANDKALTITLFNDWKQWAEVSGEFVGSMRRFADALITRKFDKWRNSMGGRGFVGIDLKQPTSTGQSSYPYMND